MAFAGDILDSLAWRPSLGGQGRRSREIQGKWSMDGSSDLGATWPFLINIVPTYN